MLGWRSCECSRTSRSTWYQFSCERRRLEYDLSATTVPLGRSTAWYSVLALPLYSCLVSWNSDRDLCCLSQRGRAWESKSAQAVPTRAPPNSTQPLPPLPRTHQCPLLRAIAAGRSGDTQMVRSPFFSRLSSGGWSGSRGAESEGRAIAIGPSSEGASSPRCENFGDLL